MTFKSLILSALMSAVVAALVGWLVLRGTVPQQPAPHAKTAFDRIVETRTMKCGYFLWPVLLEKDVATGRMKGVVYDFVEALGAALGMKIDWTAEINFQSIGNDMETGKYDMACGAIFASVSAARSVMYFSKPFYYAPIDAYARADQTKFDHAEDKLNDPSVTIAAMDGEMTEILVKQKYPKARLYTLPTTSSIGQALLDVANGKADLTLKDSLSAERFMQSNPGVLRKVELGHPVAIFGAAMLLPLGDDRLLAMVNGATDDLLNSGAVNGILDSYRLIESDKVFPVRTPFEGKQTAEAR